MCLRVNSTMSSHLVVVVVRILTNDHHLHVLPLTVNEGVEYVLSRREDLLPALLLFLEETLRMTLIPHEYKQFLKVGLCGLGVDERSPVAGHARVKLADPRSPTPSIPWIHMLLWPQFRRLRGRLLERGIALHDKPVPNPRTTMCFSMSCVNTATR